MPLAFILVVMIALMSSFWQSETSAAQAEVKLTSEAQAVAANMLAYQQYINNYVSYRNAAGQTPNRARYQSFHGNALELISAADAAGDKPENVMTWFKGPMPGVTGVIEAGELHLYYKPISSAHASQRGVQAELLRITKGSFGVGKSTLSPPG